MSRYLHPYEWLFSSLWKIQRPLELCYRHQLPTVNLILNREYIKEHLIKETDNSIVITANSHHKYSAQGKK